MTQEIKLMQAAKCGDISEVRELLDCHPHDVCSFISVNKCEYFKDTTALSMMILQTNC